MTDFRNTGIALAVLALGLGPASAQPTQPIADTLEMDIPLMSEQAVEAGIDHVHLGPWEYFLGPWEYFVGGGAASFDCNGDRFPDLALAGGERSAGLYVNRSAPGGQLMFEKTGFGVSDGELEKVTGLYALDIDNDGHRDLVLLKVGHNIILKGGSDCRFEIANRAFAFDGGRAWSTAFAAIFEADRAFPTLAFGNCVDRTAPGSSWCTCHDNRLMRPGEGDVPDYSESELLTPGFLCAFDAVYRLEPLGHTGTAYHQRPTLLP